MTRRIVLPLLVTIALCGCNKPAPPAAPVGGTTGQTDSGSGDKTETTTPAAIPDEKSAANGATSTAGTSTTPPSNVTTHPAGWSKFTTKDGLVTMYVPGVVKEQAASTPSEHGEIKVHVYKANAGQMFYSVFIDELPEKAIAALKEPGALGEQMRKRFLAEKKDTQVESEGDITGIPVIGFKQTFTYSTTQRHPVTKGPLKGRERIEAYLIGNKTVALLVDLLAIESDLSKKEFTDQIDAFFEFATVRFESGASSK